MTNYNQLNKDERDTIQYMIDKGHNFTSISNAIKKDRTTISKELKRNRYIKGYDDFFNSKYINNAIKDCELLKRIHVCNHCKDKGYCHKRKLYYNSNIAQKKYESILKESRQGVNITPEIIDEIEHAIIPLIKDKKQSINQVYLTHKDILYFSIPTLYHYIDLGVLSLCNLDLPKKVKYKPRKTDKDKKNKRELALLIGRKYDDYVNFFLEHANYTVCEMDTVIGTQDSSKVLLTILIVKTNFMLIRLMDKKNVECVNKEFDKFKDKLGTKLYSKVFCIILTDNGSEFFDPLHIEYDYNTGEKISNLFYCNPYSSWQKGNIEKNHEYIRKVFPKGTSFDDMSPETIHKLENTINNIPRKKFDGKTPYELTKELFPDFINKIGAYYIPSDDIDLNPDSFKSTKK